MKYRNLLSNTAFLLVLITSPQLSIAKENAPLSNMLDWPRMSIKEFACELEKNFNYQDKKFKCNTKKEYSPGDPCKNTNAYYQGITFPDRLVSQVNPNLKSIHLDWEGGSLRSIDLDFKHRLGREKIEELLGIELNSISMKKENILSVSIFNDERDSYLSLVGFEHNGAGDVDCGAEE